MKTFIANGDSLQISAPVGGVVGGAPFKQGSIIGIVVASAAEAELFTLSIKGAYGSVPKTTGAAWVVGDMLYWDATNSLFTKTASGNTFAGYAYEAAASGDAVGSILLSH